MLFANPIIRAHTRQKYKKFSSTNSTSKKTSKSNGYSLSDSQISNSDRLKENDQPDISVEDTGKAGWLQIVSQGSGKNLQISQMVTLKYIKPIVRNS